jgi:hypothetical protein
MKTKALILTILAVAVMMIPTAGVLAATEFWQGAATVTITDPVAITCTGGDGSYNDTDHTWAVSIIGGGTKTLKLTATNTSTAGYTVYPIVQPAASSDGKVTATWSNAAGKYIAAGTAWEYTLTVTSAADAPLGTYAFNLAFSK